MRSRTNFFFGILIIALLSVAVSESHALHELFKSLDVNKDGKVDRNEFSEDMKKDAFQKLDADGDKNITESEWKSVDNIADRNKHGELFKRIDVNRDARITFFEFSDYANVHSNIERSFILLDKDRDGALSPDELSVRPLFRMITIHF